MKPLQITPVLTGAALAAALLLAACNAEPERSANDTRDAGGEVLEGTISDDMIHFDQLRSQGVPAEVEGSGGAEGDTSQPAAQSPEEAEAAEEPAAPEAEAAE